MANRKAIAVAQFVRRLETSVRTVKKRAVGRHVVQPKSPVAPAYFAMFAGNKPAGVRQGPVKILIAANIDTARSLDRNTQRAAIGQSCFIFDFKRQQLQLSLQITHTFEATVRTV